MQQTNFYCHLFSIQLFHGKNWQIWTAETNKQTTQFMHLFIDEILMFTKHGVHVCIWSNN